MHDLAAFPAILAAVVEAVPREKIRIRASDGRFALVEHVWHLADLEEEGYAVRIERLLAEEHPALADFHGDVIAEERHYIDQEIAPALERFTRARKANAERLASLSDDQRARAGTQEGAGEVTIARVAAMMQQHDREHAADLETLLGELGIAMPALP